jgi:hypothetical protein
MFQPLLLPSTGFGSLACAPHFREHAASPNVAARSVYIVNRLGLFQVDHPA